MLETAVSYVEENIKELPGIGIILGSGLSDVLNLENPIYIDYKDIPGFPVSTVEGHKGRFIFGKYNHTNIVIMQGRIHYYEGYSMEQVVVPVRLMGLLGIKRLIITNAAGGINDNLNPGDVMIIKDHISSFVPSPLIGKNDENIGTRFPDMSHVYDMTFNKKIEDVMTENHIKVSYGTYLQTTGPQYETPAEVRMYKALGADAVGMSTVCEAIAACHMGIMVNGLSLISNKAAGPGGKLKHRDILDMSKEMSDKMEIILKGIIE